MGFGYTPTPQVLSPNDIARLRRLSHSFRAGNENMPLVFDLNSGEQMDINASPSVSAVQRGIVNYLFKNGSLAPEQFGLVDMVLVDPVGSVNKIFPDGSETVYYFPHVPDPASNTSLLQGLTLDFTTLYAANPTLTSNTWSINFTFKFDSGGTGDLVIFNPSNTAGGGGLYANGNNLKFRCASDSTKTWHTQVAPVADSFTGFHRILVINNSGVLSLYVDGTLQVMEDFTNVYNATAVTLGQAANPSSPPASEWLLGPSNTPRFFLTDQQLYKTSYLKYVEVNDNLTNTTQLNTTVSLTIPNQSASLTDESIRQVIRMKSTLDNTAAAGFKYPVDIGLIGRGGAIELHDSADGYNQTAHMGSDGLSAGYKSQAIIPQNTTLNATPMSVVYGVRTNLNTAVTVKLPIFDRAFPGTWIFFYDIDGNAASKQVRIDPDTANTGYTLNGGSLVLTAINTNWGAAELIYDHNGNTNGNWILAKYPGNFDWVVTTATTNTTLSSSGGQAQAVFMDASGGNRTVTIPLAANSAGKSIWVKKTDFSANRVDIVRSGADNFDTPDVTIVRLKSQHEAAMVTTDGSAIWRVFRMYDGGPEKLSGNLFTTQSPRAERDFLATSPASTAITLNLTSAESHEGRLLYVKNLAVNTLTLDPSGAETIDGLTTWPLKGKHSSLILYSRGNEAGGTGAAEWQTLGYVPRAILSVSVNTTVAWPTETVLANASAGNITITLPAANAYTEMVVNVKKVDSTVNTVTIDGSGAELVEDALTQVLLLQGENLTLTSDGTQWWVK